MLKPELYEKTVNILVDAYFNDTLVKGYCTACAVGNMVAANNGYKVDSRLTLTWSNGVFTRWQDVFCTSSAGQRITLSCLEGEAKNQIESTGYTWQELAHIEYAFERGEYSENKDEYMFNGLMAVIEALDLIHQNTDSNVTASTKQRFVKL